MSKKLYRFSYNMPVRIRLANGSILYCKKNMLTFLEDADYKNFKAYFVEERTTDRKVIEEKDVESGKIQINQKHTEVRENEVEPEMTKEDFIQKQLEDWQEKVVSKTNPEESEVKDNEIEKDDNIEPEKTMEETDESGSIQENESVDASVEEKGTEEVPATEEAETKTEEIVNEEVKEETASQNKRGRKRK